MENHKPLFNTTKDIILGGVATAVVFIAIFFCLFFVSGIFSFHGICQGWGGLPYVCSRSYYIQDLLIDTLTISTLFFIPIGILLGFIFIIIGLVVKKFRKK